MTKLETLIAQAQIDLSHDAQDRLADLVETFLATHAGPPDFTAAELADLRRLDGAPFDPIRPNHRGSEVSRQLRRR